MKKYIIGFIFGIVISGIIGTVALSLNSNEVSYNNSNTTATNVQDAITELYERIHTVPATVSGTLVVNLSFVSDTYYGTTNATPTKKSGKTTTHTVAVTIRIENGVVKSKTHNFTDQRGKRMNVDATQPDFITFQPYIQNMTITSVTWTPDS